MKPHLGTPLAYLLLLAILFSACAPAPTLTAAPPPDANATALAQRNQAADATEAAIKAILAATASAPTFTPTATLTPTPTSTPTPTPTVTPTPTPDYTGRYASARILVYEENPPPSAYVVISYVSIIKQALQESGLTYTYHEDRPAKLLTSLQNETWDLVIIGSEADYNLLPGTNLALTTHIEAGGAVIWEMFTLPEGSTQFNFLWNPCGLTVQGDYTDKMVRQVLLPDPSARLLQIPNRVESIGASLNFWSGDIGELFELVPGGQAQVLGQIGTKPGKDIVLASCREGRFIIQSFASHDYPHSTMLALWKNYIANALDAHYRYVDAPPDPFREVKARAQILTNHTYLQEFQKLLGYQNITSVKNPDAMRTALEHQTWDIIILKNEFNQPDYLNLVPLLQTQLEQGAKVFYDLNYFTWPDFRDVDWSQAIPEDMVSLLGGCGLTLAEPFYLTGVKIHWAIPDHPLALLPFANLGTMEVYSLTSKARLFQKLPGSQAVFPVIVSGGEDVNSRGAVAVCQESLILKATPISGEVLLLRNVLEFFLRQP